MGDPLDPKRFLELATSLIEGTSTMAKVGTRAQEEDWLQSQQAIVKVLL
jgi:hypothetical protein